MAALLRSNCRIRAGVDIVTRVLCSVHIRDRQTCSSISVGRYMSSKRERNIDNRNLQITSAKYENPFSLQHIRWSRKLEDMSPEVWTKTSIFTLKYILRGQLKTVSYGNVLAVVMDIKNKVEEHKMTFKLSAELGRELLDMITNTKHLSTTQKHNLIDLVWQIINSTHDFEFDESLYTAYVMACSENNIQISVSEIQQKMSDTGLLSNVDFLRAALCYHCSTGELDKGCKILQEMKDVGMTVNSCCFKYLVTAYAKTRLVSADDMVDIMREHSIKQDFDTYDAMLQYHATFGDMDALEKTLNKFEEDFVKVRDNNIIIKLQILLPLLQNNFQEQAIKAISSIRIPPRQPLKVNEAVEECAHSLLTSGYIEEAFQVFCLPYKRGRIFVHYFLASEEAKKADGIVKGVNLSVRLVQESLIDLRELFLDSASSSLAFLTRLIKELKELNYVKDSKQLKNSALANCRPCHWKTLILMLADLDLPTLEARADKELARHIYDPHYGTHTDCVERIHEKTIYQDEVAALNLYRKLVKEKSADPRLPALKSSGASHIQAMYLKLGKYPESLHYLKEMISLNPSHTGHLTKVLSNASGMLKSGYKDGVMESLEFYLRHRGKAFSTTIVPVVLLEILIQLLPPSQAFACLDKFYVHRRDGQAMAAHVQLMRLYTMGNDADLLATAYLEYLKLDTKPANQVITDVMFQLIEDGREDLVQKVLREMTLLMGQPLATVYCMVSLLLNKDVDAVKELHLKNPTFLKTVLTTDGKVIQMLLLKLLNKPDLLDVLLQLVVESGDTDAEMCFEDNLFAVLHNFKDLNKAQPVQALLQFSSQNPSTSLGKCMDSIMIKLPSLMMLMKSNTR